MNANFYSVKFEYWKFPINSTRSLSTEIYFIQKKIILHNIDTKYYFRPWESKKKVNHLE